MRLERSCLRKGRGEGRERVQCISVICCLNVCLTHDLNEYLFFFFLIQEAEKSEDSSGTAGLSGLHRTYSQDCSFKNSMYHVGDYVYVEPAEANLQPHIVCIERLWEDSAGKFDLN